MHQRRDDPDGRAAAPFAVRDHFEHYCALDPAPLRKATQWLDEYRVFWDRRLDALEAFLRRKRATKPHRGRR